MKLLERIDVCLTLFYWKAQLVAIILKRLYEVEDQLFALAAGTPNSTNTLIAKAKTAKYLSFQLKVRCNYCC